MTDLKDRISGLMSKELETLESTTTSAKEKGDAFNRLMQLNDIATKIEEKDALKKGSIFDRTLQVAAISVQVIGIALPLIAYGKWFREGLTFEKTGTVCSDMVKNLMGKFRTR